jgi:small subunit ribosomal protein S16
VGRKKSEEHSKVVVLRLTRTGKKKQAFYRIVAADSRRFVNSKFIEIVGWYNPKTKEVSLKADLINAWIGKGAQPSNTVAKLLKDNGIKLPDWVVITEKNRKPKKEPIVKEPKVEAPVAEEVVETPEVTEETPEIAEAVEEKTEEAAAEEPSVDVEEVTETA